MRKREILSKIKIIDAGAIFLDGECYICGKTKPVAAVWVSWNALYERTACKRCLKIYAHPKDWQLWTRIWYQHERFEQRNLAVQKLDELAIKYPKRRFFPILRELICTRSPHRKITDGIFRIYDGGSPTISEYGYITTLIKAYRNERLGLKYSNVSKRPDVIPFYSGAGSSGFF